MGSEPAFGFSVHSDVRMSLDVARSGMRGGGIEPSGDSAVSRRGAGLVAELRQRGSESGELATFRVAALGSDPVFGFFGALVGVAVGCWF